jgi:hypothetical protein
MILYEVRAGSRRESVGSALALARQMRHSCGEEMSRQKHNSPDLLKHWSPPPSPPADDGIGRKRSVAQVKAREISESEMELLRKHWSPPRSVDHRSVASIGSVNDTFVASSGTSEAGSAVCHLVYPPREENDQGQQQKDEQVSHFCDSIKAEQYTVSQSYNSIKAKLYTNADTPTSGKAK